MTNFLRVAVLGASGITASLQAQQVQCSLVVNSASFEPGLPEPGSLATVFASGVKDQAGITGAGSLPLPTSVGGVSVTVGGVAAPIHAIANVNGQQQVNFQAPFQMRGRTAAAVSTRTSDARSWSCIPWASAAATARRT